jgi:predicted metalloprotease
MRWKGREKSENVEDRRGMSPGMMVGGGGIGLLVVLGIALLIGDPKLIQQVLQQQPQQQQIPDAQNPEGLDDEAGEFIRVVLRDTETVWSELFRNQVQGGPYRPPKLVIFSGRVQSGCGIASAEVGPFYCPADQQVYIDPAFFETLARRHSASGDFAQAYVIAHEVSHHVQKLVGFADIVDKVRARGNEADTNQASVRLELQADYLAGVWAHHAHRKYDILETGDIEEAIRAANQIGDDTLMKESIGYAIPERYTHGTSEQRVRWFKKGLSSGDLNGCQALFELDYSEL